MKLEELYPALQNRYPIEQEKKVAAEKIFKEDLRRELLTIIHYAKYALENTQEDVYKAYESIIDKLFKNGINQEKANNENAYISFEIRKNYIDYSICIGYEKTFISRFMLQHDICKHLNTLLVNTYYFGDKEKTIVHFDSYLVFDLTENTVRLDFSAKRFHTGGFNEEEQTIIEKFISDLKEIFPNSEKFPDFSNVNNGLDLVLKFEYFESEYNTFVCLPEEQKNLGESIKKLNLNTKTCNALLRNNICTIEELVQLSENELRHLRNIGYKRFNEIKYKLQEIGLALLP